MAVRLGRIHQDVGEIAATTTRNPNFFSDLGRVVQEHNLEPQLLSNPRTKQARCARPNDQHVGARHAELAAD
jgi:hypothetical protein